MTPSSLTARRNFLKFLAGSPYVAALGGVAAFMERTGLAQIPQDASANLIASPAEALDVFDFEEVAHRKVQPGHWAYMSSGVDDDGTIRANRDGYLHVQLRPRRLHDAALVDMHTSFFGVTYDTPIFTCPTGHEGSFNSEAELAVAGACKARNTLQILSIATTTPSDRVMKARGAPVWQQLYTPSTFEVTQKILDRIEAAGSPTVVITVDNTTGRNMVSYLRNRPKDLNTCSSCHNVTKNSIEVKEIMFAGIELNGAHLGNASLDWEFVDKMRKYWKGKLFIKGMDTKEDARMCVDHGIDGILVSNHGGRSTNTLRATVQALPEVVAEVKGKITIFVDGGVRRGTDVFKALALGANGVGIGRPFLWGLGAFGQPGVDRVLEILQGELRLAMANCGTRTIADITRDHVAIPRDWDMA